MQLRFALAATLAAVLAFSVAAFQASAAPNGLAWDSVTKIAMNADPSTLQPGDFSADFAAASAVQTPQQSGGGFFAQMHQAMATAQSYQQMMQTGIAERHYIAGSKERTDNLAAQTATIVDCAARTITTLDLRRKTYRVTSMDQPSAPSSSGSASASRASDNGTTVAISVTNTVLGPRDVGGEPTNGYRSELTFAETNASGESQQQNGNLVAYYSKLARPLPSCSGGLPAAGNRGPAMMGGYTRLMQALAGAGMNSRISVKQSGPPLPLGKLSMYDAVTFGGGEGGQGPTFVTERGDVRPISASDPAFGIPPDFTQQQ